MQEHTDHPPLITVVIAVRDRLDGLEGCFQALERQQDAPPFEVLLVDDGSREPVADRISDTPRGFRVRVERQTSMGLAAARNLGAELARGPLLLFLHPAERLDPRALRQLELATTLHPEDSAFQLRAVAGDGSSATSLETLRLGLLFDRGRTADGHLHYLRSSGLALRRGCLGRQALFDPAHPRSLGRALLSRLGSQGRWPLEVSGASISLTADSALPGYLISRFGTGYRSEAERRSVAPPRHASNHGGFSVPYSAMIEATRELGPGTRALATLALALEHVGRIAHRCVGLRPGRRPVLSAVLDPVRECELMARLIGCARRREALAVTYLTSWTLVRAHRSRSFARTLDAFDLVYSDGMGVVLSLLLTRTARCKKVTAADLFLDLCREAVRRELSIALVGASPGVVPKVMRRLDREAPGLEVVLTSDGYFEAVERAALIERLVALQPRLIVLGMGQPLQEEFALELRARTEGTVIWCVGGLFDLLAGDTPEPKEWVRRAGFEWMHRLLTRPRTMWVRYVLGLPYLAWLVVRDPFVRAYARMSRHSHLSTTSG